MRRASASLLVAAVLALLTGAVFSGALRGGFLEYDDRVYILDNQAVRGGLSWEGARLAFTGSYAANWHPLTWLSFMADVRLFGLDPRGFHLMNVLLHAANASLLCLALHGMTGALWPSALAAALFALHPLRAESVAWIVERKDVLSLFFGLLALLAYTRYARRPAPGPYLLTTGLLAAGLAAKPMLVTWPLLMLVLDVWPLGRLAPARPAPAAPRLLLEKVPWLLMCAAVSVLTITAQSQGGAVSGDQWRQPAERLAHIVWSYAAYLGKSLWPAGLAAFYPYRARTLADLAVLGAAAALAAITFVAAAGVRRRPWLLAGWLWYLVACLPVIGFVRVGRQAIADRYTYVPLLGPGIALAWWVSRLARRPGRRRVAVITSCSAAVVLLAGMTRAQVATWRDNDALFRRMIEVWPGNPVGYFGLGRVADREGRREDAERNYLRAIRGDPAFFEARVRLGRLYLAEERRAEAADQFLAAVALDPGDPMVQSLLGMLLQERGDLAGAAEHLEAAVRLQPDLAEGHGNLGVALARLGRMNEAAQEFRRALQIRPGYVEARRNLEAVTAGTGQP